MDWDVRYEIKGRRALLEMGMKETREGARKVKNLEEGSEPL